MGNKVRIDERWRIVIPAEFRAGLKPKDELVVERRGAEIVLRKASRMDIFEEFQKTKLFVDEKFAALDAERGKHRFGGLKE